jgi:hypothetical protein
MAHRSTYIFVERFYRLCLNIVPLDKTFGKAQYQMQLLFLVIFNEVMASDELILFENTVVDRLSELSLNEAQANVHFAARQTI